MNQKERRIYMIRELLREREHGRVSGASYIDISHLPDDEKEQKEMLRGLLNIRQAAPVSEEFQEIQDAYLQEEAMAKGITDAKTLPPVLTTKRGQEIVLWQGDISTLRCGAIVNAANSGMTGCYLPNHKCIDNCIHTFSGVQLRNFCQDLMVKQGAPEPTGHAKLTPAYNLPCEYILHTVGPIISNPFGRVSARDCRLLQSCYRSCLELAEQQEIESVAFCCISTGEFHFPNEKAAEIAVDTVLGFFREETKVRKVIFNVFKDYDREIYERLLGRWETGGNTCDR